MLTYSLPVVPQPAFYSFYLRLLIILKIGNAENPLECLQVATGDPPLPLSGNCIKMCNICKFTSEEGL